jgi:hypothetical protein
VGLKCINRKGATLLRGASAGMVTQRLHISIFRFKSVTEIILSLINAWSDQAQRGTAWRQKLSIPILSVMQRYSFFIRPTVQSCARIHHSFSTYDSKKRYAIR